MAAIVKRYRDAAAPLANRAIGKLDGSVLKGEISEESTAAELISDGQLFRRPRGGQGRAPTSR